MNNLVQLDTSNINPLQEIQKRFSLINLSGEIHVIDNQEVAELKQGKTKEINFYKFKDAKILMERILQTLPVASKINTIFTQFTADNNTILYKKLAFSPRHNAPDVLNCWVGPTLSAKESQWGHLHHFLHEIICDRNDDAYNYLINYLAHAIQKPEDKPGVAIVFLSDSGCGKGTFYTLLNKIWGQSSIEVNDVKHIIGNFNAALQNNNIVFMDEALFKGNHEGMERLKNLITEKTIRVEKKYVQAYDIDSFHRFFAASNSEHFAHIPVDDRRFCFYRVSNQYKQNLEYFDQLHNTLEHGEEVAGFLHYLANLDIKGFNPKRRIITQEHIEQRIQSLKGFERFWYEALQNHGFYLSSTSYGVIRNELTEWEETPFFVATETLLLSYSQYDKKAQRYESIQSQQIAKLINKLCPHAKPTKQKPSQHEKEKRGYRLPGLLNARQCFESYFKCKIDWMNKTQTELNLEELEDEKRSEFSQEEMLDAYYESLEER